MELRGGQASLHHFYTVHQSGPHPSPQTRVGLAIRYRTARAQQTGTAARESVTWIAGKQLSPPQQQPRDGDNMRATGDGGYCFDWEPIPPAQPTPADLERGQRAHAVAVQQEAASYFATCQGQTKRTSCDQQIAINPD